MTWITVIDGWTGGRQGGGGGCVGGGGGVHDFIISGGVVLKALFTFPPCISITFIQLISSLHF